MLLSAVLVQIRVSIIQAQKGLAVQVSIYLDKDVNSVCKYICMSLIITIKRLDRSVTNCAHKSIWPRDGFKIF